MTYNALRDEIHTIARSKGWHDDIERDSDGLPTARQMLAWIALVTDELDEAEAETEPEWTADNGKPDGVLNELVDARIRCFDIAGACEFGLDAINDSAFHVLQKISGGRRRLVAAVRNGDAPMVRFRLLQLIKTLEWEFVQLSPEVDARGHLARLTTAKCEYNKTRPIRHGGKLA